MNTKFLATVSILVLTSSYTFSQNKVCKNVERTFPTHRGIRVQYPHTTTPATSYNSASTSLTVKFPPTNGGRVEIYRNGTKVIRSSAMPGATLNYVLRNYGKGNYTVIVSQGSSAVYYKNVIVK